VAGWIEVIEGIAAGEEGCPANCWC